MSPITCRAPCQSVLGQRPFCGAHCWDVLTGRPLQAQFDGSYCASMPTSDSRLCHVWQLAMACNAMHPDCDPVNTVCCLGNTAPVNKRDNTRAVQNCGCHVCVLQFSPFTQGMTKVALQGQMSLRSLLSVTPVLSLRCRIAPCLKSMSGLCVWTSVWICMSSSPHRLAGLLCSAFTCCVRLCAAEGTVGAAQVSRSSTRGFLVCGQWLARRCHCSAGVAQCRSASGSHLAAQLWLPCMEAATRSPTTGSCWHACQRCAYK